MFHPKDAKNHMRLVTVSCEDITLALSDMYLNAKQVKALGHLIDASIHMSMLYDSLNNRYIVPVHEIEAKYHDWCELYATFLKYHKEAMPK